MDNFKVNYVDLSTIKPYKNNAKKHDERQVKNVATSISKYGWTQPIVVDKNNVIIIGHCRYSAAILLNLKQVPVKVLDNISEEQVKELRNLDNKLNESDWDLDLLKQDIEGLDFSDFDIDWGLLPEIDWADITDLDDGSYEEPEAARLKCPICGAIDYKVHFRKPTADEIKKAEKEQEKK